MEKKMKFEDWKLRSFTIRRLIRDTYKCDLKEFTGKSYDEWLELRKHYEALGGVDTVSVKVLSDWVNPTFDDLRKAYNHESWMAFGYTGNFVLEEMRITEPQLNINETRAALEHFKPGMTAMDWGSGGGNHAVNLWNIGYNTIMADIALDWFLFTKWRTEKYAVEDFKCVIIGRRLGWMPKNLKIDFIVWHQVAEHMIDPDLCVEEIVKEHMNMGSLIWISCSFTGSAYHLIKNRDKFGIEENGIAICSGNERWRNHLKNIGLEEIEKCEMGSIFRKVE
jgi:2-polyprenyl-3-methyl-5-hydroxy-6-metoxy-1,4-benzoquinol methylase